MPRARSEIETEGKNPLRDFVDFTADVTLAGGVAVVEDVEAQVETVKESIVFNLTDKKGLLAESLTAIARFAEISVVPVSFTALNKGYKRRPRSLSITDLDTLKLILITRGALSLMVPVFTAALFASKQEFLRPMSLSIIPFGLTMLDALATGFVAKGIDRRNWGYNNWDYW